jgi:hypothetical protein
MILDLEVFEQKFGWLPIIRENAPYFRGRDKYIFRMFLGVKLPYCRAVQEIQFSAGPTHQMRKASAFEFAPNGAADQSPMSSDVYP